MYKHRMILLYIREVSLAAYANALQENRGEVQYQTRIQ